MPSANYRNLEEHRGAVEARATALAASLQARDLEIDELRAQITALLHAQHDAGPHNLRSTRSARCAAQEEGKVDLSHLEEALSKALALQSAAQAKASISGASSVSASVARSAPAVCIWGGAAASGDMTLTFHLHPPPQTVTPPPPTHSTLPPPIPPALDRASASQRSLHEWWGCRSYKLLVYEALSYSCMRP